MKFIVRLQTFVGILSRSEGITSLPIYVRKGTTLTILVENQGRPCYGNQIGESKVLKIFLNKLINNVHKIIRESQSCNL